MAQPSVADSSWPKVFTYTKQRDKVVKETAKRLEVPEAKVEEIIKEAESNVVVTASPPTNEPKTTPVVEREVIMAVDPTRDEMAHEHVHASDPSFVESESEIGMAESWTVNNKRTYDAYLHRDLVSLDRNQNHFDADTVAARRQQDTLFNDARVQMQTIFNLTAQAIQNAVTAADLATKQALRHTDNTIETSEMVGKQAVRHADVAIEHHWEVPEAIRVAAVGDVIRDTAKDVAQELSNS